MHQRASELPAWRTPEWWTVVLTFLQVVVIGLVGFTLRKTAEIRAAQLELTSLREKLEDSRPGIHRPAYKRLVNLGAPGENVVFDFLSANENTCLPWQQARFLENQIWSLPNASTEERKKVERLIITSWTCHHPNIGTVAEFDQSLKKHAEIACPLVVQRLGDLAAKLKKQPLAEAKLLVVLAEACPNQPSPDLEALRSQFNDDIRCFAGPWVIKITKPGKGEVTSCGHWTTFPAWRLRSDIHDDPGPYGADEALLETVVKGVIEKFEKAGPHGLDELWNELQEESLWTRLIFGQATVEKTPNAPTNRKILSGLREVINIGIQSKDSQTRFTAVGSVGQLKMHEYARVLQRIAASDEDPSVRERAAKVLATFSTP